jgi:hypothetical protein
MDTLPTMPVDWSDFIKRKRRAVTGFICVPFAFFIPAILFGSKSFMPYIAIPLGLVAVVTSIALLRQLQVVTCPKCGQPFMDQDENLLVMSTTTWHVLFRVKCTSCGAHRWMD